MPNTEFKKAYMDLPRIDKHNIRKRDLITKKCRVSTPIFYNWVKGITPIPFWAKPLIAEIMQIDKDILFPPEEL